MKSTKKPSKLRGRSGRHLWKQRCLARNEWKLHQTHRKLEQNWMHPRRFRRHNRVHSEKFWVHKAASRTFYAKFSRRLHCLQRVELNESLQFGTTLCASHENSGWESSRWQGMDKARNNVQHGSWIRSRAKRELIQEALKDIRKVHCDTLIDICHLKKRRTGTEVWEV